MTTTTDHIQNAERTLTGHGYNEPTRNDLRKADVQARLAQAAALDSIAHSLAVIAQRLNSSSTLQPAIHQSI